jgi:hypothetical protein
MTETPQIIYKIPQTDSINNQNCKDMHIVAAAPARSTDNRTGLAAQ